MVDRSAGCTRREALRTGATAIAALVIGSPVRSGPLPAGRTRSRQDRQLLRTIPRSGERIPAVGLGTESTFSGAARIVDEHGRLREALRRFHELGGRFVDAVPPWDSAERVLGRLTEDLGIRDDVFWASKISIRASGGRDAGLMQFQQSEERLGTIDLVQIQDLLRWEVQLPFLQELRNQGRIRYVGMTTSSVQQHADLERILGTEDLDFVQLDYAVDNRDAERALFPIARDRGTAILVNSAFSRGHLFRRVGDRPVPEWARAFGADTWACFFLKWVLSEPSVTAVLPGTADPDHVTANMQAGLGRLPDGDERSRMTRLIESLPD